MAEILPMLALSPTMEEGVVALWLKKEGDPVENGEVICEVETDKATMEYTSLTDGVLLKILIPENGSGRVGDPLAVIGQEGEEFEDLLAGNVPAPAAEEPAAASAATTGAAPVAADTEPAAPSEAQPAVSESADQPAEEKGEAKIPQVSAPEMAPASAPAKTEPAGKIRATPAARGLAAEKGVDLKSIAGSGPNGRVILADVEAAAGSGATPVRSVGPVSVAETDEVIPLSGVGKVIAERLSASKFSAPHFYLKVTVEMDDFMKLRMDVGAMRATKVSFNSVMMKMVAQAIRRHLIINSSWNGDSIVRHHRIDIAQAVAIEGGLMTPVVRDCGNKSIGEIDAELAALIDKARSGKLLPEEYGGATFTISNLGSFGIEEFTAIINPPGSAILAVGQTRREQVVGEGDAVRIKSVLKLTLSCDHRVIDGAAGAGFMRDLKALIEKPSLALG